MDNLQAADGKEFNENNPVDSSSKTQSNELDNVSESNNVNESQEQEVEVNEPQDLNTADETLVENIENQDNNIEVIVSDDDEHDDDIEEVDYNNFGFEQLISEMESIAESTDVLVLKEKANQLKKAFYEKYDDKFHEAKEQWDEDEAEDKLPFSFDFPLKRIFDDSFKTFKNKLSKFYNQRNQNLKDNLAKREAIVEELKNLINPQENIKDTLKHFNELREQWRQIGPIPRDNYNIVWNNYHFHVENFFDILHLDRDARDQEFKNNLELKKDIIKRAEALVDEQDVIKAFRELQGLHRIWKEDIGPVSREYREEIWQQFSDITKKIHERKDELSEAQKLKEKENQQNKEEVISFINQLISDTESKSHSDWQKAIKTLEVLRETFFKIGKAPADINEQLWNNFKESVRHFNVSKNKFYKLLKKEQQDNYNLKKALIEKANQWKDSENFEEATPVMKAIQEEWKTIGHVPRKFSDKLWNEFKGACNHYFDRLKESRKAEQSEELEAFDKKKAYLEELKQFKMTGQHQEDLSAIKNHIAHWKSLGRVPFSKRFIEGKFNKIMDALFEKLSMSKKDSELMKFSNKLEQFGSDDSNRDIRQERQYILRKIDETKSHLIQFENNMQFFSSSKKDNPLLKEAYKNIEKHKEELNLWKQKLQQLKIFENNLNKSTEEIDVSDEVDNSDSKE